MADLHELTVTELHERIEARDVSAREVTGAFLERASTLEGRLHAWNLLFEEWALRRAEAIDREIAGGCEVTPLMGIPVAVKDNICLAGMITSAGSRILQRYVPPYDATVVDRLRRAGAVVLGKTNLDEFAMGSSTENSAFGATRNPWDLARTPGGSSGGSAAVVAARCAPLALGSDTGGSIRQPAAFCGAVGIKPTYGRVSRFGLVAFASSLDQIGTLATNVRDAALLLEAIAGPDPRDSTCAPRQVPGFVSLLERDPRGVRVGIVEGWLGAGLDPAIEGAVRRIASELEGRGACVVPVDLPHTEHAVPVYYLVATAEASSNLARFDGVRYGVRAEEPRDLNDLYVRSRSAGFGREVKRRIMLGTYGLSHGYYDEFYLKAQKVRTLIRRGFDDAFDNVDVVLAPVSPTLAFNLGERVADPLAMYLSDVYTTPASLAGLPAISVPAGLAEEPRLPLAIQVIAPPFEEARALQAARWVEELAGTLPAAPCV